MTKRNEKNSELYHYLWQKYENGEITKKEESILETLHEDNDHLNLSKLCITFSTNKNSFDCWAANNIDMELSDIYELENYGIDDYIIDKIDDYINDVLINRVRNRRKELSLSENLQLANKLYFKTGELSDNDAINFV